MNLEKLRMMLVILCIVFSIVGIYYTIKLILLSLKPNKDKKYKWDNEEFNDDKDSSIGIIITPDESYSDIGEAIRYAENLIDEGIIDLHQEVESLKNNKEISPDESHNDIVDAIRYAENLIDEGIIDLDIDQTTEKVKNSKVFQEVYSITFVKATKTEDDGYDLDELDLLYITTDINECMTLAELLVYTSEMLPDIRKELNEESGDDDWEYYEDDDLIEDNVDYKIIYKESNTETDGYNIYEIFSSQMKIDCELLIESAFDILEEFDEE